MQREKLYKLQSKFYLNLDFLFPSKGNLSGAEIMLWCKNNSFTGAKIPFSYFIF
jgi:hypothetical protein